MAFKLGLILRGANLFNLFAAAGLAVTHPMRKSVFFPPMVAHYTAAKSAPLVVVPDTVRPWLSLNPDFPRSWY
jgi:hypothetical protein